MKTPRPIHLHLAPAPDALHECACPCGRRLDADDAIALVADMLEAYGDLASAARVLDLFATGPDGGPRIDPPTETIPVVRLTPLPG